MSVTEFEVLLSKRGDETEVPEGDFRNAIRDIVNFIKQYRGSEVELEEGEYPVFDDLLPDCEKVFVAVSKVVNEWFLRFPGYQLFSFENNVVNLDALVSSLFTFLKVVNNQLQPEVYENYTYSPYFYELQRGLAPVDEEVAGIIETLANGDYPRYSEFGASLFLLDFVWWGWQTFIGSPDGRGEGDISFVVSQFVGTNNFSFKCQLSQGREVLSLSAPQSVVSNYPTGISNLQVFDAATMEVFQGEPELFTDATPDKVIAFALDTKGAVITDIIMRYYEDGTNLSVMYSCNPKNNTTVAEMPLGVVLAEFTEGEFELSDSFVNDSSLATGIYLENNCSSALALVLQAFPSENQGRYLIQIFSGVRSLAQESLVFPEREE